MEPGDLSDIVDVQVEVASAAIAARGLGTIMLVTEHEVHDTRVKTYRGKPEVMLKAVLDDGHLPSSQLYRAVKTCVSQPTAPLELKAGLKKPEESWTEALTAVRTADRGWYGLFAGARELEDVLDAAKWQHARKWGLYITTPDAETSTDIANDLDQNLLQQIQELGLSRVVVVPHDAATASAVAVPSVTSKVGPFALADGAALTVTLNWGDDIVITWAAAPATVTASNAGPYDLAVGQTFAFKVNGGSLISITIAADTFPDVDAVTKAQFVAWVQAAVSTSILTVTAVGNPKFTTVKQGTDASFEIDATTTDALLAALGGLAKQEYTGSGDAADIAATTATEAVAKITAALGVNATVTVSDGAVKIAGLVPGDEGSVQIKGGSANNAFKFRRSIVIGKGTRDDFLDAGWLARCLTANIEAPRPIGGAISWDNKIVANCYADNWEVQRASIHERFGNTYELRSSDQIPGETHFGTCTDGKFIDAVTTADVCVLRMAEDFKRILNQVSKANQAIAFTDKDAGATAYTIASGRLRRLDVAGHIVADVTPPSPPAKPTGLTIPLRAEIAEEDKNQRLFGPISFVQQLKGMVHKWRVRGTLIF